MRDFPAHGAGPDDDVHAQRLANEVADGVQLVGVEVDGHQQQHLAERSRQTGRLRRKNTEVAALWDPIKCYYEDNFISLGSFSKSRFLKLA